MFGERCLGRAGCGHSTNWTCPCTCDDEYRSSAPVEQAQPLPNIVDRMQARIDGMAMYVSHGDSCRANDLDYLDDAPCTCGLRAFYNPKGVHYVAS